MCQNSASVLLFLGQNLLPFQPSPKQSNGNAIDCLLFQNKSKSFFLRVGIYEGMHMVAKHEHVTEP